MAKVRESRLKESLKVFRFLREAEEVAEWVGDQTAVAASEDYGRDVEHVELLIQVTYFIYYLIFDLFIPFRVSSNLLMTYVF